MNIRKNATKESGRRRSLLGELKSNATSSFSPSVNASPISNRCCSCAEKITHGAPAPGPPRAEREGAVFKEPHWFLLPSFLSSASPAEAASAAFAAVAGAASADPAPAPAATAAPEHINER